MKISELIYTNKDAIKYISNNWKIRYRYIDFDINGNEQWGYIVMVKDYQENFFLPDNEEYFRMVTY